MYVPRRALRSANSALLAVPRYNLERYGRRSFSRAGSTLCNALSEELRSTECIVISRWHLMSSLFYSFHAFIFIFIYL